MALRDILRSSSPTPAATSSGKTEAPPETLSESGSSLTAPIRDIVPDLIGKQNELRTYYQMSNFHAATRSSLRAVKSNLMGADYYVEPADSDQEAQDQAEFIYDNLFEGPTVPWVVTLSRIAKFIENGFQIMEPVLENRTWAPDRKMANRKTYTMLRKLAPRPAMSIVRIDYDANGGPVQIIQNALRGKTPTKGSTNVATGPNYEVEQVAIPIEKALIFTNDEDGGDLMGRSMLRSAYPHWYYIQHLYKVDAIQKERHAIGVPRVKVPPGIKSAKEKSAAKQLARDLRTNEHAGVVQPDGWDVDFIKLEGNLVNVINSIEHHNGMIMLNVLAEFLIAGLQETGGGARAVSASQQDIFMKSNRALADIVCDSINLYLIPQLMQYNFDVDEYPKLKVRNLGDTRDLQQFASSLANLFDKEILTPDMDTEQWVRRVFEMPMKLEDRPALSPTQIREVIQAQSGGGNGGSVSTRGATGPSGAGSNGNSSTVGKTGGQGNMGKGNNVI